MYDLKNWVLNDQKDFVHHLIFLFHLYLINSGSQSKSKSLHGVVTSILFSFSINQKIN